jgi:predicted dithiol-disulfide oxidoreductase (DUF899 family)
VRHLPTEPLAVSALPPVTSRDEYEAARARQPSQPKSRPASSYLRDDDDRVYETYWTTGRGNEAGFWSYNLLDRTAFGRQEPWEDSPGGWPTIPAGQHQWRAHGRPLAQWDRTDQPVTQAGTATPR